MTNSRAAWLAALAVCAHAQTGRVAYTCAPEGGPPWPVQDVCTMQLDGSSPRALTRDGRSHDPSWSADGKRLLFIHDAARPVEPSVMDWDGANRRVLRIVEPVIHSAAWSPDGNTIAISAARGIYLLPSDGKGDLRLIVENGWTPSWSPDGRKLAFAVERPRGHWTVHTAAADGTDDVRLTGGDSPAWSPDGKRIAFDHLVDASGRQQVFVMDADGAHIRQISTDPAWSCGHPSWSPSGSELVAGCRSASSPCGMGVFSTGQPMPECTRRLLVVPVDGGPVRQVLDRDGAFASVAPR
jgi:Tol biopolymer transport system component